MNKIVTIILSVVVILGLLFGVYYYNNHYKHKTINDNITTTQKTNEENEEKELIASLDEADFKLYLQGSTVILEHNGAQNEFTNWSKYISLETPTLYWGNFDDDDDNELAIKLIEGKNDSTGKYYNCIYVLSPAKNDDGSYSYSVSAATKDTWFSLMSKNVRIETSYVGDNNSRIQIVMDYVKNVVTYDPKTGFAKSGHIGFARAINATDGSSYELDYWSRGDAIYDIVDGKIELTVPFVIHFKNTTVTEVPGELHCGLTLKQNDYQISKNSTYFVPYDEYKISDPRETSKKDWSFEVKNSSQMQSSPEKIIDNISYIFNVTDKSSSSVALAKQNDDTKNIKNFVLTNKNLKITTYAGFTFSKNFVDNFNYSIIANEGESDEYKINLLDGEVVTNDDNTQTFSVSLDKSYPKTEIKTLTVKFGA